MPVEFSKSKPGNLSEAFGDIATQKMVAGIIRDRMTNNLDVRDEAFKGLDFNGFHSILDLGCGFGFFTGGLANRIREDVEVTGIDLHESYRNYYLEAAEKAGAKGRFSSDGIPVINNYPEKAYDLVICSYAINFFPLLIPQVSRILKDHGLFVIITHSCLHMRELLQLVKETISPGNIRLGQLLPYELLINRFCEYNGNELLLPFFGRVSRKDYRNELVFNRSDYQQFSDYFHSKMQFFIPPGKGNMKLLTDKILNKVTDKIDQEGPLHINKDDIIYICSQPKRITNHEA